MTRLELKQLVCNTLNVLSYRIGLQNEGKNAKSQQVMDILDFYPDNRVLSIKEHEAVIEWLDAIKIPCF